MTVKYPPELNAIRGMKIHPAEQYLAENPIFWKDVRITKVAGVGVWLPCFPHALREPSDLRDPGLRGARIVVATDQVYHTIRALWKVC